MLVDKMKALSEGNQSWLKLCKGLNETERWKKWPNSGYILLGFHTMLITHLLIQLLKHLQINGSFKITELKEK